MEKLLEEFLSAILNLAILEILKINMVNIRVHQDWLFTEWPTWRAADKNRERRAFWPVKVRGYADSFEKELYQNNQLEALAKKAP